MKTSQWSVGLIIFMLCAAALLRGQQADADHTIFSQLKSEAEKGDVRAQSAVGWCYGTGTGIQRDPVESV